MQALRSKMLNPFKYSIYTLTKLPSLFFWGVKVKEINDAFCEVQTKHSWTNQNPFGSMYFSALCGSAELSTGMLVMDQLEGRGNWSMLVTDFKATFKKKATGKIKFVCAQGAFVSIQINEIVGNENKSGKFDLISIGTNESGEEVGAFTVTWSLKLKS